MDGILAAQQVKPTAVNNSWFGVIVKVGVLIKDQKVEIIVLCRMKKVHNPP